jgi:hypothetical protein
LFNLFRIETSRVWVLVGSNPRLLNATAMAELLNQQVESIRERAERQVGVIIDSFAAGDEVRKMGFIPCSVKVYPRKNSAINL